MVKFPVPLLLMVNVFVLDPLMITCPKLVSSATSGVISPLAMTTLFPETTIAGSAKVVTPSALKLIIYGFSFGSVLPIVKNPV